MSTKTSTSTITEVQSKNFELESQVYDCFSTIDAV